MNWPSNSKNNQYVEKKTIQQNGFPPRLTTMAANRTRTSEPFFITRFQAALKAGQQEATNWSQSLDPLKKLKLEFVNIHKLSPKPEVGLFLNFMLSPINNEQAKIEAWLAGYQAIQKYQQETGTIVNLGELGSESSFWKIFWYNHDTKQAILNFDNNHQVKLIPNTTSTPIKNPQLDEFHQQLLFLLASKQPELTNKIWKKIIPRFKEATDPIDVNNILLSILQEEVIKNNSQIMQSEVIGDNSQIMRSMEKIISECESWKDLPDEQWEDKSRKIFEIIKETSNLLKSLPTNSIDTDNDILPKFITAVKNLVETSFIPYLNEKLIPKVNIMVETLLESPNVAIEGINTNNLILLHQQYSEIIENPNFASYINTIRIPINECYISSTQKILKKYQSVNQSNATDQDLTNLKKAYSFLDQFSKIYSELIDQEKQSDFQNNIDVLEKNLSTKNNEAHASIATKSPSRLEESLQAGRNIINLEQTSLELPMGEQQPDPSSDGDERAEPSDDQQDDPRSYHQADPIYFNDILSSILKEDGIQNNSQIMRTMEKIISECDFWKDLQDEQWEDKSRKIFEIIKETSDLLKSLPTNSIDTDNDILRNFIKKFQGLITSSFIPYLNEKLIPKVNIMVETLLESPNVAIEGINTNNLILLHQQYSEIIENPNFASYINTIRIAINECYISSTQKILKKYQSVNQSNATDQDLTNLKKAYSFLNQFSKIYSDLIDQEKQSDFQNNIDVLEKNLSTKNNEAHASIATKSPSRLEESLQAGRNIINLEQTSLELLKKFKLEFVNIHKLSPKPEVGSFLDFMLSLENDDQAKIEAWLEGYKTIKQYLQQSTKIVNFDDDDSQYIFWNNFQYNHKTKKATILNFNNNQQAKFIYINSEEGMSTIVQNQMMDQFNQKLLLCCNQTLRNKIWKKKLSMGEQQPDPSSDGGELAKPSGDDEDDDPRIYNQADHIYFNDILSSILKEEGIQYNTQIMQSMEKIISEFEFWKDLPDKQWKDKSLKTLEIIKETSILMKLLQYLPTNSPDNYNTILSNFIITVQGLITSSFIPYLNETLIDTVDNMIKKLSQTTVSQPDIQVEEINDKDLIILYQQLKEMQDSKIIEPSVFENSIEKIKINIHRYYTLETDKIIKTEGESEKTKVENLINLYQQLKKMQDLKIIELSVFENSIEKIKKSITNYFKVNTDQIIERCQSANKPNATITIESLVEALINLRKADDFLNNFSNKYPDLIILSEFKETSEKIQSQINELTGIFSDKMMSNLKSIVNNQNIIKINMANTLTELTCKLSSKYLTIEDDPIVVGSNIYTKKYIEEYWQKLKITDPYTQYKDPYTQYKEKDKEFCMGKIKDVIRSPLSDIFLQTNANLQNLEDKIKSHKNNQLWDLSNLHEDDLKEVFVNTLLISFIELKIENLQHPENNQKLTEALKKTTFPPISCPQEVPPISCPQEAHPISLQTDDGAELVDVDQKYWDHSRLLKDFRVAYHAIRPHLEQLNLINDEQKLQLLKQHLQSFQTALIAQQIPVSPTHHPRRHHM